MQPYIKAAHTVRMGQWLSAASQNSRVCTAAAWWTVQTLWSKHDGVIRFASYCTSEFSFSADYIHNRRNNRRVYAL